MGYAQGGMTRDVALCGLRLGVATLISINVGLGHFSTNMEALSQRNRGCNAPYYLFLIQ